jgi:hypothetical protein
LAGSSVGSSAPTKKSRYAAAELRVVTHATAAYRREKFVMRPPTKLETELETKIASEPGLRAEAQLVMKRRR